MPWPSLLADRLKAPKSWLVFKVLGDASTNPVSLLSPDLPVDSAAAATVEDGSVKDGVQPSKKPSAASAVKASIVAQPRASSIIVEEAVSAAAFQRGGPVTTSGGDRLSDITAREAILVSREALLIEREQAVIAEMQTVRARIPLPAYHLMLRPAVVLSCCPIIADQLLYFRCTFSPVSPPSRRHLLLPAHHHYCLQVLGTLYQEAAVMPLAARETAYKSAGILRAVRVSAAPPAHASFPLITTAPYLHLVHMCCSRS